MLGAISEFNKAMTVAKLRGARERKRREAGKCQGRKSHGELNPELVREAKRLRRRSPKGHQRSLRDVAPSSNALVMSMSAANGSRPRLCSQC
jgi:DNA invertase Pin-like site-specific DNA recombinase